MSVHKSSDGTWRAGRAWLWLGQRACFGVEWTLGKVSFGIGFSTGGERDLVLRFTVPGLSLYLTAEGVVPYGWLDRGWPRDTSVRVFHSKIWLCLFCQDWMHPPEKGWTWTLDPIGWLLGRPESHKRVISKAEGVVPMPEGAYPCTVEMSEWIWRRPRSPFRKRLVRGEVSVESGVPHPGKGTTDYNCGDDATYSIMCPARDPEEAIGTFVASVLRSRREYPL